MFSWGIYIYLLYDVFMFLLQLRTSGGNKYYWIVENVHGRYKLCVNPKGDSVHLVKAVKEKVGDHEIYRLKLRPWKDADVDAFLFDIN